MTLEERALELEQIERDDRADRRAAFLRDGAEYLLWFVSGLLLMGWSFHTTDTRYAELAFWGGMLVGDGGMLLVLVRRHRRAVHKGWV
ncbi:MAG TPA: hypothetical protein VNO75_03335 [Gemmatimonadaceae bacterium]|nr:hypothetical protein [Gemmatimonadaceae bacterium]